MCVVVEPHCSTVFIWGGSTYPVIAYHQSLYNTFMYFLYNYTKVYLIWLFELVCYQ